jgi:hypothetical protein
MEEGNKELEELLHKNKWLKDTIERSLMDLFRNQLECPFKVYNRTDPTHVRAWCRLGPRAPWMPFEVECPYRAGGMEYVNPGYYQHCRYDCTNPKPIKKITTFSV